MLEFVSLEGKVAFWSVRPRELSVEGSPAHFVKVFVTCLMENCLILYLEAEKSNYKWFFDLDNSNLFHRKWLFNQTSTKKTGCLEFQLKIPSRKLILAMENHHFDRKYLFKWCIFQCHVCFLFGGGYIQYTVSKVKKRGSCGFLGVSVPRKLQHTLRAHPGPQSP